MPKLDIIDALELLLENAPDTATGRIVRAAIQEIRSLRKERHEMINKYTAVSTRLQSILSEHPAIEKVEDK